MPIVAMGGVVDTIAIANVATIRGAITPDRALHEPRKRLGEGRIKLPRIDLGCEQAENVSASSWPIAAEAVEVVGGQTPQDTGSVQEIMNERIYCYEGCAGFKPQWPSLAGCEE